jgi:hypothetical protein
MALVPYLRWIGIGALVAVAVWIASRRLRSRPLRHVLRCLAVAAAITPQPLWIPGQGGALMPALALLVGVRPSVFGLAMGAFPILAVGAVLFVVAGFALARDAVGDERLLHRSARRWVLMGLLLPWLAFAVWAPFLAYFAFGGPIALWGSASLVLLAAAALLDCRAAARTRAEGRALTWTTWLLAAILALAVLWRFVGVRHLVSEGP